MRITLAQINPTPGDLHHNSNLIIEHIESAKKQKSDLVVFPEMSLTGYPPLDLLDYPAFADEVEERYHYIATQCCDIAAIIGAPVINSSERGKRLFNSALFLQDGAVRKVVSKALLPSYDVFDEARYFEASTDFSLTEYMGVKIAITVCEDMWGDEPPFNTKGKKSLYQVNPVKELAHLNPDLIINISAAPFAHNRIETRIELFKKSAAKIGKPVITVNQCGANGELIFDGSSLAVSASGSVIHRLTPFTEETLTVELNDLLTQTGESKPLPGKNELILGALVTGLSDYQRKTKQKGVVLGLSGGIDSALCAAIAVEALGKEQVTGILMPSRYSSNHSVSDALLLADKLGITHYTISIEEAFNTFEKSLGSLFKGKEADITEENIQARVRAVILMAYSNKFGHMLINTSNKSEAATGYGTMYGDMTGAISPLGDLYKTEVYSLAQHINREKEIIPHSSITKPPSAELRENQTDQESLPSYEILDAILYKIIDLQMKSADIIAEGFNRFDVEKTEKLLRTSEFKRYQAPPILRVSAKAFGSGRRIPLVANYKF